MDRNREAQFCTHNADRHTQITGRADGNAVLLEKVSEFIGEQLAVIIRFGQQASLKSQLFTRLARGNSVRFSADLEPIYFEQLTSERKVVRYFKGQPVRRFERIPGKRAETLDATVYAIAARTLVTMNLDRREDELSTAAAPKQVQTVFKSSYLNR